MSDKKLLELPNVREADERVYARLENGVVECRLCERRCKIKRGSLGYCKTRKNVEGKLFTLVFGDVGLFMDVNPIEKKPFFHFFPGSITLTVGTWSCNFPCLWCQNWHMSKTPPKPEKACYVSPEEFIELTLKNGCEGTSFSFNEPTLLFEYSCEVFRLARRKNLYNTYVSNGYMSKEALKILIEEGLDAINIDVKGDEDFVKKYCNADLRKIWRNVKIAKEHGVHVELTTLLIPGKNDSEDSLKNIAKTIKRIDETIPWHVTRYHPAYKALESGFPSIPTPVERLERAYEIAKEVGLKYVYVGNVWGSKYENTFCHSCGKLVVKRFGFDVLEVNLDEKNKCKHCGEEIPIVGKAKVSKVSEYWL